MVYGFINWILYIKIEIINILNKIIIIELYIHIKIK